MHYPSKDGKTVFVPQPDGSTLIIRLIRGVLRTFIGRPR